MGKEITLITKQNKLPALSIDNLVEQLIITEQFKEYDKEIRNELKTREAYKNDLVTIVNTPASTTTTTKEVTNFEWDINKMFNLLQLNFPKDQLASFIVNKVSEEEVANYLVRADRKIDGALKIEDFRTTKTETVTETKETKGTFSVRFSKKFKEAIKGE